MPHHNIIPLCLSVSLSPLRVRYNFSECVSESITRYVLGGTPREKVRYVLEAIAEIVLRAAITAPPWDACQRVCGAVLATEQNRFQMTVTRFFVDYMVNTNS